MKHEAKKLNRHMQMLVGLQYKVNTTKYHKLPLDTIGYNAIPNNIK